jgi:hypothetical protein
MSHQRPCPIEDQPAHEGGQREASIGEQVAPAFEFRYTPEQGTGHPQAHCAFRAFSQQALAQQEIDKTQACRRCGRVVRVLCVKQSSMPLPRPTESAEQLTFPAERKPPVH